MILVDDHPIVRAGMIKLLTEQPDIHVSAEASDGLEAVELSRTVEADLVVMDFSLPKLSGPEATREIRRAQPNVAVLGLSMHEDVPFVRAMLDAGAGGYLLKRSAVEELVRAVRLVASGKTYVDPAIAGTSFDPLSPPRVVAGAARAAGLSEREEEVARQLALGATMKEIAEQLGVSPRTLETYRARAMDKLGLKTRAELVRYALSAGWMRVD